MDTLFIAGCTDNWGDCFVVGQYPVDVSATIEVSLLDQHIPAVYFVVIGLVLHGVGHRVFPFGIL
jgi:hypothetical protein